MENRDEVQIVLFPETCRRIIMSLKTPRSSLTIASRMTKALICKTVGNRARSRGVVNEIVRRVVNLGHSVLKRRRAGSRPGLGCSVHHEALDDTVEVHRMRILTSPLFGTEAMS